MFTISSIIEDIDRNCAANNMVENAFSYRLVYFVNAENGSEKHYIDTRYKDLRSAMENIIRGNLTVTNTVVIAAVTTLKDGKCVSLLGKAYGFNLNEYFRQIYGGKEKYHIGNRYYKNNNYGRKKAQWY